MGLRITVRRGGDRAGRWGVPLELAQPLVFHNESESDPLGHLSASSITGWLTCARCWALDNVEHQTKAGSVHYAVGSTVHHGIERVGRMVIEGTDEELPVAAELIVEESLEIFDQEVGKEASRNGTEIIPPTPEEAAKAKDVARKITAFALPEFRRLFKERGLVAVEYELPPSLNPFPFPFTGRCDAISGGKRKGLPLILSDAKTAAQQRRPDQNNRVQGGIYGLFIQKSGELPQVLFDTLAKTVTPTLKTYGLGPEGEAYMSSPQLTVVYEEVCLIAEMISEGYRAHLESDWRTYHKCFPIGQGFVGGHDFDHGFPDAHERLIVSFPGLAP